MRNGAALRAAVAADGAGPGDPVTLGIRPEDLRIGEEALRARVTLVEWLGNICFAYLDSDAVDEPLIVQLPAGSDLQEGEIVSLGAAADGCHLFDAAGRAFPRQRQDGPEARREAEQA